MDQISTHCFQLICDLGVADAVTLLGEAELAESAGHLIHESRIRLIKTVWAADLWDTREQIFHD